jgi:hypothetical protein
MYCRSPDLLTIDGAFPPALTSFLRNSSGIALRPPRPLREDPGNRCNWQFLHTSTSCRAMEPMSIARIVNEFHEIIAQKKPKGTSEYVILAKAMDSFIPQNKARVSEEKAREIVLARGALARKRLEQAEGGTISAEQVADLFGLNRQGVDYLRQAKRIVAWRLGSGKWHYPVWQFHDGRVRPIRLIPFTCHPGL